ncbi:MAG: glycine cleavage system aminomethyltransferase GcvT [Bernardetiaceae bacterium]|nr:glycine cleavage system aminomethyltransferase GcvT [Bernardetiaceae bacterium]
MQEPTQKVALDAVHREAGAKMIPFAGFEMPVWYDSQIAEHHAVRQAVGMFDVSHMGEFFLRGEHALTLIQKVISNDATTLYDGKALYAYLPNEKGGIVDDLLVYRLSEQEYMLVVNASNIEKDLAWIQSHNEWNVEIEDRSAHLSLFAVQGPKAIEALQSLTDTDLAAIKFYHFEQGTMAGIENVIISATGYTGAGGFELYLPNEQAEKLWHAIINAGKPYGLVPVGLAARDTLRLEKGYCLYGNDIDENTSPIEAGLGWVTKFNKNFINSEALQKQKEEGVAQKLVGFVLEDKGIARKDHAITDAEGNIIGRVTSGVPSPTLGKSIGLGYIKKPFDKNDTEIFIAIRPKKQVKARVTKIPFV